MNEFRWQYSYEERPRVNNNESDDFVSKVGPQVQVTGCCFFGGVSFLPVQQYDDRLQFTENLSIIKGAHNVKVGFDYNHSFVDQVFRGNWRGVYIFNTIDNFVRARNKQINPATNQPYTADQYRLFFGDGAFAAGVNEYASYIQDTYKVSSRLTLNLGLRHEAFLDASTHAAQSLAAAEFQYSKRQSHVAASCRYYLRLSRATEKRC